MRLEVFTTVCSLCMAATSMKLLAGLYFAEGFCAGEKMPDVGALGPSSCWKIFSEAALMEDIKSHDPPMPAALPDMTEHFMGLPGYQRAGKGPADEST